MSPLDLTTSPAHRLLQVFISEQLRGIFEVYIELVTMDLWCTCPGWWFKNFYSVYEPRCIHTDEIEDAMENDDGGYEVEIINTTAPRLTDQDAQDPVAFRSWVIMNTKIKVLQN